MVLTRRSPEKEQPPAGITAHRRSRVGTSRRDMADERAERVARQAQAMQANQQVEDKDA